MGSPIRLIRNALLVFITSSAFFVFPFAQEAEATVSFDGFDLSCPASANEGGTVACTLTNTGDEAKDWPVVGILHLSSDANRALVRGSPLDLQLETPAPASGIGGGLWWIGDVLVAYSRFDWGGEASAQASRTVSIIIENDDDYEGEEIFYVSLAPHRSRGVGFLYTNRQAITISASDTKSSDADLSDLKIAETDAQDTDSILSGFSSATTSYTVTVAYRATEAIVTPTANHKRATITVDGESVESGKGSPAIPLGVGSTAIEVVVTAENGDAKTYQINVTRQPRAETVEVKADGFTLVCPSSIAEGSNISCALTNTNSTSEDWPVVAIIHSSSDGDSRALLAEDTRIPESNPSFGIDVRLSDVQTPARENYNHGYGELFSGGSTSVYTTYGYQKFDWAGQGTPSATRSVVIQTMADDEVESAEIFYVAVAPSGYTGLSRLVDNKAPIIIEGKDTTPPPVNKIAISSDPGADGTYAFGDVIEVTVTFSEDILVTGTPQLTLRVGNQDRTADYESVTDAKVLFRYQVGTDDLDSNGVSIAADSLSLNGGTIKDGSDNEVDLDHRGLGNQSQHKVDGIKPVLAATGGAVVNGPTLMLTYDEPLDGDSTPEPSAFTVAGGSSSLTATGVRLSGSTVELTLDPAVGQGETGIQVSYMVPTGTGASPVRDAAGNEADGLSNEPVTNEIPETALPNMWLDPPESDPMVPVRSQAIYSVTFQGSWTTTVTADGVPSGAHFTTLIGGVHNAGVTFLSEGGMASAGVESMAELGGTSTLAAEVRAAEPDALAVVQGSGGNIGPTGSSTINPVTLTTDHPRVTLLSMVAPSPDWFVGVSGLSMLDAQGNWLSSQTVNLYPWDAGTEEGTEFSLTNSATSPQETITSLRGMGKFSNAPIATLAFTRQSINTAPSFTSDMSFEVDENQTAVATVVAADPDGGDGVAYAVTGGADASWFEIGETTGVLTFKVPPNYERAADVASADPLNDAGNNEYIVTVTATGGTNDRAMMTDQTITVTVRNLEEAGTVSFSKVGAEIRATLNDPDGGVSSASWQWARSSDRSGGWTDIGGATSARYSPSSDDKEMYLRATVSYNDGHGSGKQAQGVSADEITPPKLLVSTLVSGLSIPWDLAFAPDGTMLFTQRGGVLSSRLTNGTVRTVTAELGDLFASGETGLMGIVVDPDFASNRRFYTCQGHTGPEIQVIAWTINAAYTEATRVADPLVGGLPAVSGRHGGCRLRFGPEGYLWIATGDAATGTVPQDLSSLGGKVLRVDASTGAGAPANPLASSPRIYTYGHRNVQGLALRPDSSQMWSVEHGPSVDDEINLLVAGRNYGWDPVPGYNEGVPMTGLVKFPDAVEAKWSSGSPTLATSGGIFLQGDQWGVWEGRLAVATLRDSKLRLFEFTPEGGLVSQVVVPELDGDFGRLRTPMMDPDGALYVTTSNGSNSDRILRIVKDDAVPVTLKLTPEAIGETGGVSTVTASLERESNAVTTVSVSAEAVAPAGPGDFALSVNRTLTIAVGETLSTGEVTVGAVDDNVDGPNKMVIVSATAENINGVTQPSAMTLTIIDDDATPVIMTTSPLLVAENETVIATLQATDEDDRTEDLEWDITGGNDRSQFTLTRGGELAFTAAKDYEEPDDSDRDRDYEVTVQVNDGANAVEADFTVRLQDVDDTAPAVSGIRISSNPGTDRTYAAEDEIRVTVTFSETVEVTGTPQLSLELGGGRRTATYEGGSGTAALVFAYEVAGGESDTDGVGVEAGSLSGGTIRDEARNNAELDHDGLAADSGHKVDAVKPQLAATGGVVVDGAALTLTYGELLDGSSTLAAGDFTVSGGDSARAVSNAAVSGSAVALTLDPAVEHGETGVTVSYTPGTNPIRDVAGNEAEALSRVPVSNETPDTTAPGVISLAISSNPGSDQAYAAEDVIEVTVSFSETVEVTGTPQLRLRVGSSNRTADYLRGTDTEELVFGYEVDDGHEDTDGVSIEAGRIALNGGTIEDEADNPAELAHEAVAAQAGHKVDGVRPVFVSTAVDGSSLTLTYGETLDGGSRPAPGDFTVEVGGAGRSVTGVSASGSVVTLTLSAAVEHGDTGIRVSYTPGTNPIQDAVGNDARGLSNQAVTNTTGAPNTAPEITTVGPFTVRENQALVRRLAARDNDSGDEVTGWSIMGGADQSQFSITSDTGDLSFQEAPDYESPTDVVSGDPPSGAGDNEYVVTVEVRSGAGARELEAEQTFTVRVTDEREPPGIPEAPAFSGETAGSLTVRWSEPENTGPPIMDYDVRYREKGPGHFIDAQHMGPGLSLTLADLEPGTAYEVQVRATNDEGTSDWSDPEEGMTVTPLTVDMMGGTEPPVEGPFTVRFSFSEPVRGFTQAAIETAQDPACTDEQNNPVFCEPDIGRLETVDDRVFSTTVTPQTDRVAHNYTLTLTVSGGAVRSSVGNKLNEEAMLGGRVAPPGVTLPISEIGLRASGLDRAGRLNWNRPTNDGGSPIIRYEHRHAPVGEVWNDWENVGARATGVTVGNLVNGLEYVFEVRAVNALGKGPVETAAAIPVLRTGPPPGGGGGGGGGPRQTVPSAPSNLLADATDGAVTLMWEAPADDGGAAITDYEYRIDGKGDWISIGSTDTTHTVTGLVNGTEYIFEVRAVNSNRQEAGLPTGSRPRRGRR